MSILYFFFLIHHKTNQLRYYIFLEFPDKASNLVKQNIILLYLHLYHKYKTRNTFTFLFTLPYLFKHMNKKPLIFILASIYSFNSFAQVSVQNVANGAAVAGTGYLVWKSVKNPLGAIAILALTGFAAHLIHYAVMKTIGWTKDKLIETFLDPSKNEEEFIDLMYDHPLIFDKLHKDLLLASQKLTNKDALKVVNDFIDYHHLGEDKEFEQIMQSAKYIEYQKYYAEQAKIIEQQGNYKNICDMQKYKMVTTPINLFSYKTKDNSLLFSVEHYRIFSYDFYKSHKFTTVEHDHVPSSRALHSFFNLKNTNRTLQGNGIAVRLPILIHSEGSRTHSNRNKREINGIKQYELDSNNLLLATIKDLSFTTTFMVLKNYPVHEYLKSGIYILEKNYQLCLYN